jgi:uncharacterized radical SAM superfamily Fe-S cluster-containing enzyme
MKKKSIINHLSFNGALPNSQERKKTIVISTKLKKTNNKKITPIISCHVSYNIPISDIIRTNNALYNLLSLSDEGKKSPS